VKQSQPEFSNCPIDSEYAFIDIHRDYRSCLEKYAIYNGKTYLLDGHKYGYENVQYLEFSRFRKPSVSNEIYQHKAIDLHYYGIPCPIDFKLFKNLEYLRLRDIQEIPKQVFELENLKVLFLDSKNLKEIPDNLVQLKNLEVLEIYPADGVEKMTDRIGELTELKILSLSRFYSIESFHIDFSKLVKLKRLDVWDNNAVIIDSSIANCKELQYMEVRNYNRVFTSLPKLRILALNEVDSEDEISNLDKISGLEELYVHYYKPNVIAKSIQDLPNLKNLGIGFVGELNVNMGISRLSKLKFLSIHCDNLFELPKFKMPNLIYLNIVDTQNRNGISSVRNLENYPNLKYLRLIIADNRSGLDFEKSKLKTRTKFIGS